MGGAALGARGRRQRGAARSVILLRSSGRTALHRTDRTLSRARGIAGARERFRGLTVPPPAPRNMTSPPPSFPRCELRFVPGDLCSWIGPAPVQSHPWSAARVLLPIVGAMRRSGGTKHGGPPRVPPASSTHALSFRRRRNGSLPRTAPAARGASREATATLFPPRSVHRPNPDNRARALPLLPRLRGRKRPARFPAGPHARSRPSRAG